MSKAKSWRTVMFALLAALALVAAACGSGDDEAANDDSSSSESGASGDQPTIVVTTNILGDVVNEIVGDQANVVTIMPVGADPHDFQPSAQEVDQLLQADALIVNGTSFEEGLLDVIDSAMEDGVPTFEATSAVETIEFSEGGHDEHSDEEHSDEEHSDEEHSDEEHSDEEHSDDEHSDEDKDEHSDEEHSDEDKDEHSDEEHSDEEHSDDEHSDEEGHEGHDHEGADPHFFTDPNRMAEAVSGIEAFLAGVDGIDADALSTSAAAYIAELESLDDEVQALVDAIPEDQRVLVTNHEVFGYFADQYGFEVVGVVIPSGSTADSASAGELAELAETIEAEGVATIFADTSASTALVDTLAAEVGDVAVVELFSESLGESGSDGATYLEMVKTNATRISEGLS